jgi:hypothetical protein
VIPTPVMLSGVRLSPKIAAEMLIVVAFFAMSAIDMCTTPARWMILWAFKILSTPSAKKKKKNHVNSLRTIQNAAIPGIVRKKIVCAAFQPTKNELLNRLNKSSMMRLIVLRVRPIAGASQYIVAAGLSIPIFLFFSKS